MTNNEKWPPIDPGTPVVTTQPNVKLKKEWTAAGWEEKKWGVHGIIQGHHDSHGLCYDIRHEDGSSATYDPSEFAVVPSEETSMETYFVLNSSGGGIYIEQVSKREIEARLNDRYYGEDAIILERIPQMDGGHFEVPGSGDRSKVLIIKGQIVTPKPVKIVTRFEL